MTNITTEKKMDPERWRYFRAEGQQVDRAGLIFFAFEQVGNEVGAEQEEEADAKRAGDAEGAEDAVRDIKTVIKEDKKEGEEAKDIEFRPIESNICRGQ